MEIWYFLDKVRSKENPQARVDLQIAAWLVGLLTGSLEAIYFIKRLKNSLKNQHVKISIRNRWALLNRNWFLKNGQDKNWIEVNSYQNVGWKKRANCYLLEVNSSCNVMGFKL